MKFAICNETYQDQPFATVCQHVARCGYDGIEIAPFTFADDPRKITEAQGAEIGRIARSAGLEIVGQHWLLVKPEGMHLTTPEEGVREKTVRFAKHLARLCAAMGGKVMVWGSPKQRNVAPDQTYEDAFRLATDALRRIADTAGPLGVTLAMEPLSTVETNFLTTAEETVRLIEAVNHPACRLHLDVKAMSSEEREIATIIRTCRQHLVHFHANDANLRGPGFGEIDYGPIAAALEEIGYNQYVSVEVFDYSPDAETIALESINYLRRHFKGTG